MNGGTIGPGFEPHQYLLAGMWTAKRSAGISPDVNLGERVTCTPPLSANKAAHSGFETQRRHYQKSRTGVSMAAQKGLMSSKIFFKKLKKKQPPKQHDDFAQEKLQCRSISINQSNKAKDLLNENRITTK